MKRKSYGRYEKEMRSRVRDVDRTRGFTREECRCEEEWETHSGAKWFMVYDRDIKSRKSGMFGFW